MGRAPIACSASPPFAPAQVGCQTEEVLLRRDINLLPQTHHLGGRRSHGPSQGGGSILATPYYCQGTLGLARPRRLLP
jgi:hypothetical protein